MSKQLFLIKIILFFLSFSFTIVGNELQEERALGNFDRISATNGVNILLRKSTKNKAEIKITNALLSDVITEVKNNTLKIKLRPQINKELSVVVIVYYKNIKSISATKGASIKTKSVLLNETLEIKANTGSRILAEIECSNLSISNFGGSKVTLYGWSDRADVKSAAKSKTDLKKIKIDNVLCRTTSGAECWVHATEYLEGIANTGGTIFLTHTPKKINKKTSSGGEMINKSHENRIGYDLIKDE